MRTFEERAERVLTVACRGLHHCGDIKKSKGRWETNHYGELSTFDHDILTRLVISAHDNCVRLTIANSGPRMVKIILFERYSRAGNFSERHPTIAQAVLNFRVNHPESEIEQ